ncbi:MAG: hypothetical protein IT324_00150 [Anaerolineae bacterium]|nr:hypothetical protein [Anaerolineae bacterium]
MLFDWLGREGGAILSWWLLTLLAGVAVYPLFFQLTGALPSRGYALARTAGLMLTGFVFWLFGVLGLWPNTPGSTVLAALIVFGVGLVSYTTWRDREPILPWLRSNLRLIVATELLFAALFFGWVLVRALNPSLIATEKPMEMAFLSAIRRSATFPPHDPWMSGYAISYYHFGYIIVAALANLSGVTSGMAFNLALPLLFALTGTGAFGVAYDLVMARKQSLALNPPPDKKSSRRKSDVPSFDEDASAVSGLLPPQPSAIWIGVLAAVFAVIMGNLGTVLVEIPYQTCAAPAGYLRWMGLEERDAYPVQNVNGTSCGTSGTLDANDWNFWWWFRYSRVVRDRNLSGQPIGVQPITEFPQFSFVLSDMHPHVLALPFAMLAIGLALNLAMRKRRPAAWELLLYAIFVGGMVFLNSWDAVYLGLLIGAEGLRRLIANGTGRFTSDDWRGLLIFGASLIGLTAILYLPFFISFRSQAGGIVPNVIWPTEFQQFFLMFGPFLVILGVYLALEWRRAGASFNAGYALRVIGIALVFIALAFVVLMVVAWSRQDVRGVVYQTLDESGGLVGVLLPVFMRRLSGVITEGLLLLAIFVVIARLFAREPHTDEGTLDQAREVITYSPSTGFTLLIIAAGAVLTLAPDFVYLRDDFGVRINTVFKLYYQGWLLWSIASACAVWSVLAEVVPLTKRVTKLKHDGEMVTSDELAGEVRPSIGLRTVFTVVVTVLVMIGLVYPTLAIPSRALKEADRYNANAPALTLDGGPSLAVNADDYAAIQCLANVAHSDNDVVAEAADPTVAYNNQYGRVSGLSGIPTLIGWENHERQWRGDTFDEAANLVFEGGRRVDGRAEAVARLYNDTGWTQAQEVIKKYGITYIYVGPTERSKYNPEGLAKFKDLPPVCASGDAAVYSVEAIQPQTAATN